MSVFWFSALRCFFVYFHLRFAFPRLDLSSAAVFEDLVVLNAASAGRAGPAGRYTAATAAVVLPSL